MADFSVIKWGTAASQQYSVSEAQGEVVNGKLYSFGGFDSQKSVFTPTSRAYVYDPAANTWKAIAPMPPMNGTSFGGVTHAGFATDGTDIYFAGGYTSNAKGLGQIFGTKEVWKYSVAENKYERLPDLPIVVAAGQLEYLNGKLHHISGTNAARTRDLGNHYVLDLRNPEAGWKTLAPLPTPRQHAGSAVFGGKIYYIGGQTGHDTELITRKDVHRYDPATDTWAKMADLPAPGGTNGRGHISSSVVVADNRLLVLGGETSHGHTTSMVSAYTPATNTWENLTPLPAARFSGVAGFLAGNIYYTGGASATTYKGVPQTAATGNPYLVVENQDKFPAPDHLAFSNIQIPWHRDGTPYNANHNRVKLKVSNKGNDALVIKDLSLSNTSAWKIDQLGSSDYSAAALPITVKAGGAVTLTIEFIARDQADRVKVLHDTLYISSNDVVSPTKKVYLHGLWQRQGEDVREPWAQEIIHAFGFQTNTGYNHDDGSIDGKSIVPNSDEVLSSHFVRVDESRPVEVIQMAAYHGCCNDIENFEWYYPDGTLKSLFTHDNLDGQSLLPRKSNDLTKSARGTFNPTGPFGFRVGRTYSDRTKNSEERIGMRIWKAIDASGNIIPNAYIIGSDYLGNPYTNYDYQDNTYFIRNIRPKTGTAYYSELTASPSALYFDSVMVSSSERLEVTLSSQGKTYEDGSSDPEIQIKSVEIVGPDKNEFKTAMPATATLAVQASTNIMVEFAPDNRGIKNAALLVHYSSSDSPLRIPLYGKARDADSTVVLVKRIKGAADQSITIGGKVWEADKNYRKGSVKLDKQVVTTPVAATDYDVLYQSYLSAATDLAETRYEIPVADGKYMLRMHFIENYWSEEAARLFDITIENELRLANLDIYKEVGYRTALVKDFEVRVTDGVLNIRFSPAANRVAIAGLEIFTDSASENVTGIPPGVEPKARLVEVYPNPTTGDEARVVVEHFASKEEVTIIMYDVLGRKVYTKTLVTDNDGEASAKLTVAAYKKGLYIIKASAASGEAFYKLLIQ
ncbi:kelch repeat-containing protein [Pontibacter rufus]|uniref:kelch repeat-containing protein n=1 Tax=Pontibacter rufus TaxID=2791028 RepID=UPI001E2BA11F|nr:kelch repeat-containing protein [Pontibacter sp. 172403-2]